VTNRARRLEIEKQKEKKKGGSEDTLIEAGISTTQHTTKSEEAPKSEKVKAIPFSQSREKRSDEEGNYQRRQADTTTGR
jgi:hypothetical protein